MKNGLGEWFGILVKEYSLLVLWEGEVEGIAWRKWSCLTGVAGAELFGEGARKGSGVPTVSPKGCGFGQHGSTKSSTSERQKSAANAFRRPDGTMVSLPHAKTLAISLSLHPHPSRSCNYNILSIPT